MEVVAIFITLIYLVLACISWGVAAGKGRSGIGWFVISLIFPIAILFVLIAPPLETSASAPRAIGQQPSGEWKDTTKTNVERIVETLQKQPGLDDDELSMITGILPRQQVNQICRRLERQGRLRREQGPRGKIVNYLNEEDNANMIRLKRDPTFKGLVP